METDFSGFNSPNPSWDLLNSKEMPLSENDINQCAKSKTICAFYLGTIIGEIRKICPDFPRVKLVKSTDPVYCNLYETYKLFLAAVAWHDKIWIIKENPKIIISDK